MVAERSERRDLPSSEPQLPSSYDSSISQIEDGRLRERTQQISEFYARRDVPIPIYVLTGNYCDSSRILGLNREQTEKFIRAVRKSGIIAPVVDSQYGWTGRPTKSFDLDRLVALGAIKEELSQLSEFSFKDFSDVSWDEVGRSAQQHLGELPAAQVINVENTDSEEAYGLMPIESAESIMVTLERLSGEISDLVREDVKLEDGNGKTPQNGEATPASPSQEIPVNPIQPLEPVDKFPSVPPHRETALRAPQKPVTDKDSDSLRSSPSVNRRIDASDTSQQAPVVPKGSRLLNRLKQKRREAQREQGTDMEERGLVSRGRNIVTLNTLEAIPVEDPLPPLFLDRNKAMLYRSTIDAHPNTVVGKPFIPEELLGPLLSRWTREDIEGLASRLHASPTSVLSFEKDMEFFAAMTVRYIAWRAEGNSLKFGHFSANPKKIWTALFSADLRMAAKVLSHFEEQMKSEDPVTLEVVMRNLRAIPIVDPRRVIEPLNK